MLDSFEKENSQPVQDCLPTIFVLKRKSKDTPALESGLLRKSGSWQAPGDKAGLRLQGNLSPGMSTQLPCAPDPGFLVPSAPGVVWVRLWTFRDKHFLFPLRTDA